MKCALCEGNLLLVLELEPTAAANELLVHNGTPDVYSLNLMKCTLCNHIQLDTELPKERLFKHYTYVSDTGQSNRDYFEKYAKEMTTKFKPTFVVDIGSNDGLFLSYFNCNVLGVDPAINLNKKVGTIVDFFNVNSAKDIVKNYGKADLITCNNMFAHNRDLSEILKGIKLLLTDHGTFVFEVSYAVNLLQSNLFDLVYHEHYHHWTINPMIAYFQKFGLKVVDAKLKETHGGSIRVFVKHNNDLIKQSDNLKTLMKFEKENIDNLLCLFTKEVEDNKLIAKLFLKGIKGSNNTISILGYPAKACTVSYYYGLDKDLITNVFDDNSLKIGKYSHKGFKIKSTNEIMNYPCDYLLILSWNYAEQLMKKHNRFKGKFIVLFPTIRIL